MNLYLENLTFSSFLFVYLNKYLKDISQNSKHIIYYIDASRIGKICGQLFGKIFRVEFQQLKFKMMDIKDENGELVRLRIPRKDLFEIQNKIIQSIEYHQLYYPKWGLNRLEEFLKKGITDGSTQDNLSCSRILYLINVIHWHNKNQITHECQFIVLRRAWFKIYKDYSSNFDVTLIEYSNILKLDLKYRIRQLIFKSPYLYIFYRNLKNRKYNSKKKSTLSKRPKLYLEGRGDVNLVNNGHHSDFFWQMNSDFDANNLLYNAKTDEVRVFGDSGIRYLDAELMAVMSSTESIQGLDPELTGLRLQANDRIIVPEGTAITTATVLSVIQSLGIAAAIYFQLTSGN